MAIEIEEIVLKARVTDNDAGMQLDPEPSEDMPDEDEQAAQDMSEQLDEFRRAILDTCARMIRTALSEQKMR